MFGGVRNHDVIHGDVRDINAFGLELRAEAGTVKASTEDGSFIDVHIDHNLPFSNGGLHGLVNHGRSGGTTGEDNGPDVRLQKEMSWETAATSQKRTKDKLALTKHA